ARRDDPVRHRLARVRGGDGRDPGRGSAPDSRKRPHSSSRHEVRTARPRRGPRGRRPGLHAAMTSLIDLVPADEVPDAELPEAVFEAFVEWAGERGFTLYPHQEDALLEIVSGANVILSTPTGSGKSLVAAAAHFAALANGRTTYYTAPI